MAGQPVCSTVDSSRPDLPYGKINQRSKDLYYIFNQSIIKQYSGASSWESGLACSVRKPNGRLRSVPSGLLEDEGGWYYEESQDYSSSQQTIRIEQDRPGDWYVRDSFCEVDGLNEPDRGPTSWRFFAGSYRWLHLERRPNGRHGQQGHRGHRDLLAAPQGQGKETPPRLSHSGLARTSEPRMSAKMWGRIRFIKFPGRRPRYQIRFDLMVELDEDTFD